MGSTFPNNHRPGSNAEYVNEASLGHSAQYKRERYEYWTRVAALAEKDGSRSEKEIAAMRRVAEKYRNESMLMEIMQGKKERRNCNEG